MPNARLVPVLRHLQKLATAPGTADSDAVLLGRVTDQCDQDAFAVLVRRHGPLVWQVCRRVLGNSDVCEDAFQATFLVLARKADSIRKPAALPGWLHKTAFRVACAAKAGLRRHPSGPIPDVPAATMGPLQEAAAREIGRILEEEVAALPEPLRLAVVLCYWGGRTNEEAAQQLGWASGTLKARLTRARELLHERLLRRGITLPAGVLGLLLAPGGSEAVPPVAMVTATIQSAMHTVDAVASGTAERVLTLADGVTKAMFLSKLKFGVALLLVLALLGLGLASLAAAFQAPVPQPPGGGKQPDANEKPVKPKVLVQPKAAPSDRIEPGDRLKIRVLETLPAQPIDGVFVVEASGKVALGFAYGRVEIKGRSLEDAEPVIKAHLSAILKAPVVSVTRYDPIADASQGAVVKQLERIEQRMEQLEKELQALRLIVEKLDKKLRD